MKAYLVLDLTINDLKAFGKYIEEIPAFIIRYGGNYIVKGEVPTVIEGNWSPDRLVVIEFPSSANALAFLDDPEAQSLFAIRHQTTRSKLLLVEGCT
jgi:uncharacterized protein (DUF1330 family)